MATFKVGQKVKKIANRNPADFRRAPKTLVAPLGTEGTVIAVGDGEYFVEFGDFGPGWTLPYMMAPLTDPKAEAFLESIRQLKPLPVQEIA